MRVILTLRQAMLFCSILLAPVSGTAQDEISYQLTDGRSVVPLERFRECDQCPEMIVMPLGSFMMGAIEGESRNPFDFYGENATGEVRGPEEVNIIPSEHPRHPVEMDIPYAMGRNEITHAEWMACVDDGGCTHNPDHHAVTLQGYVRLEANHPVVNVSYQDVHEYIEWLNRNKCISPANGGRMGICRACGYNDAVRSRR